MTTMQASERSPGSWPVRRRLPAALATWLAGTLFVAPAVAQNPQWAIYVMRTDGSQVRRLAQVDGCTDHSSPRWSHDGKHVAFDANSGGRSASAVYIVSADGSGLRKLGEHSEPDWSPDDKQIALVSYSPGRPVEINVQNLDGKGRTQIAPGNSVRWSPDGAELAISDGRSVSVMDLVTGEGHGVFDRPLYGVFSGFSWSPDGKRLAVVVRPEEGKPRELLLVDARGEAQGIRLRMEGGMGGFVSFSPDGKELVFCNGWKVRIVELDGRSIPRLLPGQMGKNRNPDWSPDGKWIVFASDRDGP